MPYNDDENHSPSEFYYPEQTTDPKNTAERLALKAFFGLFYKVTTNCNPTKPYNKSLISLVCSVCMGKYCPRFLSHSPRSFVARSVRKLPHSRLHIICFCTPEGIRFFSFVSPLLHLNNIQEIFAFCSVPRKVEQHFRK